MSGERIVLIEDDREIQNTLKSVLEGVGYRFYSDTAETLLRLPGYPIMLFFLFYFFGESLSAAKFANVLSGGEI